MRLISGILDILYFRIRHSFAHLRPVILSADWSIRGLQSWTCSRLPIVAEFVKLTQSIVIDIQRQSADLYKLRLCNKRHFSIDCLGGYRYSRFDFRVEKIAGSQQSIGLSKLSSLPAVQRLQTCQV